MSRWLILPFALAGAMATANAQTFEQYDPKPNPDAVQQIGHARFTVLTSSLIRMEWSSTGRFEDRASQAFVHRNLPVPEYKATRDADTLTIGTGHLKLVYTGDGARFAPANLSVTLKVAGRIVTWRPGMKDTGNLRGTWRTLDGVSGASSLEPGILSRDGWVVVDDSNRLVFDTYPGADQPWLQARTNGGDIDWYFFGYGHDYQRALQDFTRVAGRIPLPPRFVFGTWWSRYWAYSDQELRDLVNEFREHDVPLDVLVIDMDWHLDGWTGYTWNPKYFPDPEGFLKWVHEQGLRTTLNLHPASGVGKHEKAFPDVAKAIGVDPETTETIPFDCTDPSYMRAYFEHLQRPHEKIGVDFWWIDWQQGTGSKIPGLDPLWWLNHLHWTDMERRAQETGRRPLIFSRWGGLGNHRYQIGFSGDTFCNWPSLAFQPYFTATAGNVGFAYWSHDIGGHQPGPVDPELYARWIQYGMLSPILRTHTTKNALAERRIWKFPKPVFEAARQAFHLRHALIPYIYTAARQCYDTGLPLCRPLYYEWPERPEAYERGDEYLFGDSLLAAPVTEAADAASGCAQVQVWLPPGTWTNWFTGRTIKGPGEVRLLVPLNEIPLFVRDGAIIPTRPRPHRSDEEPLDPLVLHIWPGDAGEIRVYTDDGISAGYATGSCAWTPVLQKKAGDRCEIVIGPTEVPTTRDVLMPTRYEIRLRDVWPARSVTVNGAEVARAAETDDTGWHFEPESMSVVIRLPRQPETDRTQLVVTTVADAPDDRILRDGLRGKFALLRQIGEITNRPSLADEMTADLFAALTKGEPIAEAVSRFEQQWAALGARLTKANVPRDARARALIRWLGLFCKLGVTAESTIPVTLTASMEISPTRALGRANRLQGHARLDVDPPWQLRGEYDWQFGDISASKPFMERAAMMSHGFPQTGRLRAAIALEFGDVKVDLPIEHVFLPSINAWHVIGPFPAPFAEAMGTEFPPEKAIDLKASYPGLDGKAVKWQTVERHLEPGANLADEFFVDFDDVFGGRKNNAVAYALCYLVAPEPQKVELALGTDDGVVVWLNDEAVHRVEGGRAYTAKQDRVPVRLNKGPNKLLLKINQGGGDWGFCVHVERPDGQPATAVVPQLDPDALP